VPALVGATAYAVGVPDGAAVPLAVIAGAAEGAVLGFAQSSVLRHEIAGFDRRAFVTATASAAAFAWAIGMPLGTYGHSLPLLVLVPAVAVGGAAILLSIGAAQAFVLKRYVARAGRWVAANAVAWLVGLVVPFAGMALVDEGDPAWLVAIAGVLSGLGMAAVVAAVTGIAIVALLEPAPRPMRFKNHVVNPLVRALLRSPLHRLLDRSLLLLTYTGRVSGRRHTLPVMYAEAQRGLVAFAAEPERKRWWRNLRGGEAVTVRLRGRELDGYACLVEEPAEVARGLAVYLARYPRAAKALAVRLVDGRPCPHDIERAARTAVMVSIEPRLPASPAPSR
jgi:hypothetical protein